MVYNVGIVGTGFGSLVHYPGFVNHPEFEPVVITGRDEQKTKTIAKRISCPKWSTNWQKVVADPEIDVISIATPPKSHKEIILESIRNGKHILCEKPLTVTLKEAEEVCKEIEDSGLVGMVNLEFRYLHNRAYFLELLKSDYIGEIQDFSIIIRNSSRLNPRTKGYNWWSEKSEGGGVLFSVGVHYIDFILQVFGKITRVYGHPMIYVPKRLNKQTGKMKQVTADDAYAAIFEIGDKGHGIMQISSVSPFGKGTRMEFYGSSGFLALDEKGRIWAGRLGEHDSPTQLSLPTQNESASTKRKHPLVDAFVRLLNDFAGGIASGRSPSPNFFDALQLQRVLTALNSSSSYGKAMKV